MSSVAAFAGSVPANYDKYLGPILFDVYAMDIVSRLQGAKLKNVLELACGTGRVTNHIAPLLQPEGRLIATDLNADMIKIAKEKVSDDRIEWQVVDAQELPYADNSFDHIICQYGIMFFPEKLKSLKEAYRVLQPGGKYIFNAWDSLENNPVPALIKKVLDEMFGSEAPDFLTKGPYSFYDTSVMKQMAKEAGFKVAKLDTVSKTVKDDPEKLVTGFMDGSPLTGYLSDKNETVKSELRTRISKELRKQVDGENIKLQAFVCELVK